MKYLERHILIWLFLFYGLSADASHVLGGEIFYKHIKDNQYKVTLNIYRDCNGCKINGTGGGNSSENCSEIDYLYVKGTDNTNSKETKFALTREKISDITPTCRTKISTCNSGSNSSFGIEIQQFSATVDLDNSTIKGFCNYYLYVTLAERNNNITTGQAKQNFCIDAFIQTCIDSKNNSPNFTSPPTFIVNSNKTQYQSIFVTDSDNDSLVYSFTPALYGIDKEVSYSSGFSYSNPLTVHCIGTSPCSADKLKETGFYLDPINGTIIFIPVKDSEIGVVAMKVEEYRKISGKWELIGYIKRDIQVYIKTSDGNSSPKFLNKDYFEICEEEPLIIKIETKEDLNLDSVSYSLNTSITGCSFNQYNQSNAPYNYGIFKWIPPIGASAQGIYTFSVSATDNYCPLKAVSDQIITVRVKPKENLKITTKDLGCGNFELFTSTISKSSKLNINLYTLGVEKLVFSTNLINDTISFLPEGKYIIKAKLISDNGCVTTFIDTLNNFNTKTNSLISGIENVCKGVDYIYTVDNVINPKFDIKWVVGSEKIGNGESIQTKFLSNGILSSILNSKNGKWICSDTLRKEISVIEMPEIVTSGKREVCHNTGNFDLKNIPIVPSDGIWSSLNTNYQNGYLNTNSTLAYYDDTILLIYEITRSGCKLSKSISFIILAVPEFELSSLSICEISSPVLFQNLIKKPYQISDYTFNWNIPLFQDKIKDVNGYKAFYPSEIGFGNFKYDGELLAKNGCKNYDTATVDITAIVKIQFDNEINLCQGSGPIDISKISGVIPDNGNWSFIDFDLIKDRKFARTDTCGVFDATYVYDNYGCYDTKTVSITIACKPEMQISGLKDKVCDSELPLQLTAKPLGGIWDGNYISGNIFNPPLVSDTKLYTLNYIISKNQCNFKETKTISIIPSPIIEINTDKYNFCEPEPIKISGIVRNTDKITCKYFDNYFEENLSRSIDYLNNTIFNSQYDKTTSNQTLIFTSTSKEGCSSTKQILIKVFDQPLISPFTDTFVCENSNYLFTPYITYKGLEQLSYSWNENLQEISNQRNLNPNKLNVGNHKLTFRTGNTYCNDSKSINVEIKPKPVVDFIIMPTNTTTIMQPNFLFLNQSGLNQSWLWDFGTNKDNNFSIERSPQYSYSDTGNYMVSLTGTDIFGCTNTLYKTVVVRPDLLIFIPNAFSPNNKDEEKNNVFSVSLENYDSYSIEIFDRWGHKLFYSEDPKETWDGKSGGVSCTPDIYFYSIKINSITNHLYKYRGTITLIK